MSAPNHLDPKDLTPVQWLALCVALLVIILVPASLFLLNPIHL